MLRLDCRSKANPLMKILLLASIFCVVAFSNARDAFTQQRQASRTAIQEVKSKPVAIAAPRECLAAFRNFFGYLQKAGTDIIRDETAQKRWLTQELRKALAQKVATF